MFTRYKPLVRSRICNSKAIHLNFPVHCRHAVHTDFPENPSLYFIAAAIGTAKGEYIEVYHGAVSGSVADAAAIGGIIGRVGDNAAGGRSVVKVTSAMVSAGLNPGGSNKIQGGIFGEVCMDSMAAMDGTEMASLRQTGYASCIATACYISTHLYMMQLAPVQIAHCLYSVPGIIADYSAGLSAACYTCLYR